MFWLWTLAALTVDGPLEQIEIPGHFLRPRAVWEDLNGDGQIDVWLYDRDKSGERTQLWVWDGAAQAAQFQQIPFEPAGFTAKPAMTDRGWQARAYERGVTYEYDEQTGWTAVFDFNKLARIRPGLSPIAHGNHSLVPTFSGYWLIQDDCPLQSFRTVPAVELKKRVMRLIYPKPEWRDVDGDGEPDLLAAPIPFRQQAELRVWSAMRQDDGWAPRWSAFQFPPELKPVQHQYGDLNGDGHPDLVALARPAEDLSLFDELSFVVYLADGPGQWQNLPVQVLKTKQNLWQTGPIEISEKGVLLLYYKGLFSSIFRMDLFRWNAGGYIEPKPVHEAWKLKGGKRDVIYNRYDVNGDGLNDLILYDRRGVYAHYRKSAGQLPFDQEPSAILFNDFVSRKQLRKRKRKAAPGEDADMQVEEIRRGARIRPNRAYGNGSMAIVADAATRRPTLWKLYMDPRSGYWRIRRLY